MYSPLCWEILNYNLVLTIIFRSDIISLRSPFKVLQDLSLYTPDVKGLELQNNINNSEYSSEYH